MTSQVALILIVEDETIIRHLLESTFTEGGFAVTLASSGEQAITMLDKEGVDCSALITDINLSGKLTGWDVAKHAREINDKLPVVYMTGASAREWGSKGVPNSQLMQKPFAITQVTTAVAQLINAAAGAG